MALLAIKGHPTRGKEVIALLEMLGGSNLYNYKADSSSLCFYCNKDNIIYYDWVNNCYEDEDVLIFTLEEFLEKFPYKVGDKVITKDKFIGTITDIRWQGDSFFVGKEEGDIVYTVQVYTNSQITYQKEDLQIYKEETMSKNICDSCLDNEGCLVECTRKKQEREKETEKNLDWFLTDYLEFENNDDTWADEVEVNLGNDYEIQVRDGKTFIVKKKPQYPKTYKECCELLSLGEDGKLYTKGYKASLIQNFQKLLICRDAYWKIAGEQMGLDKPWKPNWAKADEIKYCIVNTEWNITKWVQKTTNKIFAFPTAEMRDAFYENFKKLIEECKELL